MTLLLAVAAGCALAAVAYVPLAALGSRRWVPAAFRAVAVVILALLLLDPLLPAGRRARPLVLLDASLSLGAAGGQWQHARDTAFALGEVRLVGDVSPRSDTAPTRGTSRLAPALRAAAAVGRPLVLVSDGEVADAHELDLSLLRGARVVVLPREPVADLALTALTGPDRAVLGDTLRLEVEVSAISAPAGTAPRDSLALSVTSRGRQLLRRPVGAFSGASRRVRLELPAAALGAGTHVLRVALAGSSDPEPRDDARFHLVRIAATPGAVLLASPGDWDARFLHRALRDVADIPVRGFIRLGSSWREMEDLEPASEAEVGRAAQGADLLVLKGATGAFAAGSRARGIVHWPSGAYGAPLLPGDWFLASAGASPLAGTLAGIPLESLPPLQRVMEAPSSEVAWVGATAQAGRRGTPRPVITGETRGRRREVVVRADGLWRWAFRGGAGEQAYRSLVAGLATWLLAAPDSAVGAARPVQAVVQRGLPVRFAWAGAGAPVDLPISLESDSARVLDTLAFDGTGRAELWLDPGIWRYALGATGRGVVAVEEYSDEWMPRPVSLESAAGATAPSAPGEPLRTRWWPYLVGVLALGAEWFSRRRLGLR
ncbi:MAG: hypothetical protein ACREMH_06710 [Gemmatimonadales bacterium]